MTDNSEQCIGLIAGAGEVPILIARKAAQNGTRIIAVSLSSDIAVRLESHVHKNYSIGVGRVHKILKTLRNENVSRLILAGKVEKSMVFKLQLFDMKTLKLLMDLKSRQDKTILEKGISVAEEEGFTVLDQKVFLK